jgi:DNA-binding transcriptional ArsR family regulator
MPASRLDAQLRGQAPVFAALGDATRLRLVARLSTGQALSISRLAEGETVTRQAVTKHLHVLEEAGLVRGVRAGRERLWELETRQIAEARRCLERIAGQWDAALARLKAHIEQEHH